jgi:hypothetical protein
MKVWYTYTSMFVNENDPIPLISPDAYSYLEAKRHARVMDEWIKIQIPQTEALIEANPAYRRPESQFWVGLEPQILQTPYVELRMLLEQIRLQPRQKIVDLGAAYSRLAYVVGRYYPESFYEGYEYIPERVDESLRAYERFKFSNIKIQQNDITTNDFEMPLANYYFIYDFGSKSAIEKVMENLSNIADTRPITVIGRGRLIRDIIERQHPWLANVYPPEHFKGYSLYYSFLKENINNAPSNLERFAK